MSTTPNEPSRESAWERRRRLDEVFGDVLPDVTTDEQAEPTERTGDRDDWLWSQVPPHHG